MSDDSVGALREQVIQKILVEMSSTLDLDRLLDIITRALDEHFGLKHSIVLLPKEGEKDQLEVVAARGESGAGPRVEIPLSIDDRSIGVLAVESPTPDIAAEPAMKLLANQAASAIHNALLYRSLQRMSETLEERVRERTEDLRRAQAQLVQSEKMASLGLLVAGIAHEINTPIGAMCSMHDTLFRALDKTRAAVDAELPEDHPLRHKIAAMAPIFEDAKRVIESGTERVSTIVKRLRTFARLDEAELKEVDIHEGIEDTLSLIRHELKGVQVVKSYGELPRLTCHPGRLNQVFLNLIMNAKQALGGPGGEIRIETRASGPRIEVAVSDNGVGIAEEHLKRVLDPGFTTKGVGLGTGLGLSICDQIVKDHHGELRIESEPGRGTTVTVVLPIAGPTQK